MIFKRKKKKHPEDFIGKLVHWRREATSSVASELADESGSLAGVVQSQELVLQVQLPNGTVVGVDSRLVEVKNAD